MNLSSIHRLALVVFLCELTNFVIGSVETGAFVHLFEWKWSDVAQECEEFLGPMGFQAVQVSPAMEHIQGDTWWTRYQPVSYKIQSRSGNETEFKDMTSRCAKAGVSIIADAVINHMAEAPSSGESQGIAGTSFNGRSFEPYDYDPSNTHHYDGNDNANCVINNYDDQNNVQQCDLDGLVDLDTENPQVQDIIANYISNLHKLGADGYRVDAAKHINANSLSAIISKAPSIYHFQEVISGQNEAVTPEMYTPYGDVTEFDYGINLWKVFQADSSQQASSLSNFGEAWGMIDSDKAVTFTDNHDTQRTSDNVLTYKDGYNYDMANYFMLAYPYGHPKVMSSYYFTDVDAGPPGVNVHEDGKIHCDDGKNYVCEHRRTGISGMVKFRKIVGDEQKTLWQVDDSNGNRIAFARGSKGFLAMNMDKHDSWNAELQTGLPDGEYCNVIISKYEECDNDAKVYVENGNIKANIPPVQALAIHV